MKKVQPMNERRRQKRTPTSMKIFLLSFSLRHESSYRLIMREVTCAKKLSIVKVVASPTRRRMFVLENESKMFM